MTLFETTIAHSNKAETWQGTEDARNLDVLTGGLPLAFIALVILMRTRP